MSVAPKQRPLLGILGGMGPLATLDFLGKLTRLTTATCDQHHLPWLTVSQPAVPDRSRAIQSGSDGPKDYLAEGAAYLASQGVALIAIPCNTSHFWFEAIQAASSVPVVHIVEAAIDDLNRSHPCAGRVAVLATRGTVDAGIYAVPLRAQGFDVFVMDDALQKIVDGVISDVKEGRVDRAVVAMQVAADTLAAHDVRVVMLACTELPIAWNHVVSGLATIDTSLALARGCLRRLDYRAPRDRADAEASEVSA